MNKHHSASEVSKKSRIKKALPLALGASFLIAASMVPSAYAAEAGSNAGSGFASTVRKLVKKPAKKVKYVTPARSPYVCTVSGFGKKGGCYLR